MSDVKIDIANAVEVWWFFGVLIGLYIIMFFIASKPFSKDGKRDVQFAINITFNLVKVILHPVLVSFLLYDVFRHNEGEIGLYQAVLIILLIINWLEALKNIIIGFIRDKRKIENN